MNLSGIMGVLIGLTAIVGTLAFESGSVSSIIQPTAIIIVIGGTFGAAILNFSLQTMLSSFKAAKEVFVDTQEKTLEIAQLIIEMAKISHQEGILTLQNIADSIEDSFLRRGVRLAVDITNPQLLQEVLTTEINLDEEQELIYSRVFEALGGYAPTFGIVGAVLGLIQVMNHLQDPASLGHGIATAFVATLYGVGLANMIFLPIAGKLKMKLREKILLKEMVVHGLISIQMGENPAIIEEKLISFLNFSHRQNSIFLDYGEETVR